MKTAGWVVAEAIVETFPEVDVSERDVDFRRMPYQFSGQQADPDAEEHAFSVLGAALPLG